MNKFVNSFPLRKKEQMQSQNTESQGEGVDKNGTKICSCQLQGFTSAEMRAYSAPDVCACLFSIMFPLKASP